MTLNTEDLQSAVAEAEALRRRGEVQAARRRLTEALHASRTDRRGAPALSSEVFLVEHMASLAVLAGDTALAELLLEVAGAEHTVTGEWWRADFATLQRVHVALTANRIDDARERFRETTIGSVSSFPRDDGELDRWEASLQCPIDWRERLLTSAYLELSRFCTATGAFEQAVRYAARGLKMTTSEHAQVMVRDSRAPLLLASVEARLAQGHLVLARPLLASIGPLDTSRQPAWRAQWLVLATRMDWLEGNLGKAIEHASTHLEFCVALRLDHAVAQAKLNIAELRLQLNEHAAARELLDDVAISDAPMLQPEIAARLAFLETAWTEQRTLYFDAPRSVLEQQRRRTAGPQPPVAAPATPADLWNVSHAMLVDTLLSRLRSAGADRAVLDELRAAVEQSDSPLMSARLAFALGLHVYAAARVGDPRRFAEAEGHLAEARWLFASLGVAVELYECQRWLAWTCRRLGRQEPAWRALRRDNTALLDRIAATLDIQDRAAFFLNKWSEEEEDLAEELAAIDAQQKAARRFAPIARLRLMARRNRLIDRLFALRDAFARTVVAGEPASAAEPEIPHTPLWRRLLVPPRNATAILLVLPNAVATLSISLGRIACGITATPREKIRQLVAAGHRGWDTPVAGILMQAIGLDVSLEALPRRIRRLTILADDVLHGVPFAALPFDARPLVHRFAITMAHGTRPHTNGRLPSGEPAALFAGIRRGLPNQPVLENGPQLRVVRPAVAAGGLHELDDDNGSPAELLEWLRKVDLAHVTCHGVFDPENAHRTGLVLPDRAEGTVLTLRDLSRERFPRLRLAVLVSCWSADAYIRPGRWVVSAPETICRAGARSVIAALWEVDNVRVAELLDILYRNLKTMRCDEALRQAQLEVAETMLPYVWAAFQLHGRGGRLQWKGFR
jgi:CHAT domain-containing protein